MSKDLSLENLAEYDGGSVALLVNQSLRKIYLDLDDRPMVKKTRKIVIELNFTPKASGNELDAVETLIKVRERIPDKEARECTLVPSNQRGALQFDPHSTVTRTAPGQNDLDLDFDDDAAE